MIIILYYNKTWGYLIADDYYHMQQYFFTTCTMLLTYSVLLKLGK